MPPCVRAVVPLALAEHLEDDLLVGRWRFPTPVSLMRNTTWSLPALSSSFEAHDAALGELEPRC